MRKILIIILTLILFSSCEIGQRIPPQDYIVDNAWASVFNAFWHGMNDNYTFWFLDSPGSEWDSIYKEYFPQFEKLGEINSSTSEAGGRLFYEILKGLDDMHYSLDISDGQYLRFWFNAGINKQLEKLGYSEEEILNCFLYYDEFYALYEDDRYGKSDYLRENIGTIMYYTFSLPVLDEYGYRDMYLESSESESLETKAGEYFEEYIALSHHLTVFLDNLNVMLGKTGDGIVYFGFSNSIFSVYQDFLATEDESEIQLLGKRLEKILSTFKSWIAEDGTKGLIIDLRGNGGGVEDDIPLLWGRLDDEPFIYSLTRAKIGDSRLDYTSWVPIRFLPDKDGIAMNDDVPIAVLVNSSSASFSELTLMIMKALQEKGRSIRIIGNTTVGATGYITDSTDMDNSGTFEAVPYLSLSASSMHNAYKDGTVYERTGIDPDEMVPFNSDEFEKGNDGRLQAAFSYIRNLI